MQLIIADTGVVSRRLIGKQPFIDAFDYIGKERIVITAITKIELFHWVNGFKNGLGEKGYRNTIAEINKFPTIQIDRKVSAIAVDLAQRYFTKVGDLLIASIAIHNGIEIFTVNTKDFKSIKGVNLYTPPNYLEIKDTL
jgi:predicted nucleic acid-binding protein